MKNVSNLENDLRFVSQTVHDSQFKGVPLIYVLWGVISIVGFSMIDWSPEWAGIFWAVMGPVGAIASAYLGRRYSRQIGQANRQKAMQNTIHWTAMLVAIFMTYFLVEWNYISPKGQSLVILEIIALSYVTAGSYLDKNLRWLGILIALSILPMAIYGSYMWTALGIVFGAALFLTAFLEGRKNAQLA